MEVPGDTGEIACDHYHRWRDDIALMSSLGLRAYRFSISWSRLLPNGTLAGGTNEPDLLLLRADYGLLAAGIAPYVTLYTGTCRRHCRRTRCRAGCRARS